MNKEAPKSKGRARESVIDMTRKKGRGKKSKKGKVRYVLMPIRFTMRDIEEAFYEIKPALDKLREYDLKHGKN